MVKVDSLILPAVLVVGGYFLLKEFQKATDTLSDSISNIPGVNYLSGNEGIVPDSIQNPLEALWDALTGGTSQPTQPPSGFMGNLWDYVEGGFK